MIGSNAKNKALQVGLRRSNRQSQNRRALPVGQSGIPADWSKGRSGRSGDVAWQRRHFPTSWELCPKVELGLEMDSGAIRAKFGQDYAHERTLVMGIVLPFTTEIAARFRNRQVLETCTATDFSLDSLSVA
jgi:hypothetical protein